MSERCDDYSDDFISDEDDQRRPTRNKSYPIYGRNKPVAKTRGRGRGRGSSQRSSQRNSPRLDNTTQRVLSANRYKINELHNQLSDMNIVVKDMREENKLLKKMQYRHEKALNKFEGQEGDLPKLIYRHNNELKSVQEHLRNMREKYERTERYLRDAEDDLERVTSKMKKYKGLADKKGLPERDDLNRKLSRAEIDIEEKDSKINELTHYIENLSKNHRHELGVEIARHRDTKRQLDQVKEEKDSLDYRLKEREKELDIRNIYSNRGMKLPASYAGTPLDSPTPSRRRIPSITEMTARERAKVFEMKRRDEMKQKRTKPKVKSQALFDNRNSSFENEQHILEEGKKKLEEENIYLRDLEDKEREREKFMERELERQKQRDLEEDNHKRARERLKRESQEFEKEQRERREREERERREREERVRRDKEDRERKEKEEYAQKEKEHNLEIEDEFKRERQHEIIEREDRETKALEIEQKAKEERARLENDPRRIEEQQKKDVLLARMRAIDAGKKETAITPNLSPFDDTQSIASSKKSYTFSRPTENLHNGKPAYEDYNRNSGVGDFGGYDPSFGNEASKDNKKAALMNELFGDQTTKTNNENDALFFITDSKKTSGKRASAFPWDDGKSSASRPPRENSSTIFGGGAALVDDDTSSSKSKLLPRRNRHQMNTYSSKPLMMAPDANFDDDIEEVVL